MKIDGMEGQMTCNFTSFGALPGRVAQSIGHLTRKSGVLGSILGLATYFRFSFRVFSRRAVVSYWRKYVHEVLVNRLGGLSPPRKSVVRLTDRPDMTLDVYRGRKTTIQQQQQQSFGAIVLDKLSVPGRPAAVGAGGVVWTYSLSSVYSLFFLSLRPS